MCMHGYIPRVTIFHAWLYPTCGYIPHVTIPRVAIRTPRVALHETCMFHAIRKRSPRKHVTGYIGFTRDYTRGNAWKSEVIIERYRILMCLEHQGNKNYEAIQPV